MASKPIGRYPKRKISIAARVNNTDSTASVRAMINMTNPTSKPRDRLIRWRVNLLKGTPAKFIDFVEAPDEKTAEDIAARDH